MGTLDESATAFKCRAFHEEAQHPSKNYESHRYWKRIDVGISDLVDNQDLVEQSARPYIVGDLSKTILSRKKRAKRA